MLALSQLVLLLGLVGTPPTVASLFYYLRWLAPAFSREGSAQSAPPTVRPIAAACAVSAAVASMLLGLGSGAVLALAG